MIWCRQRGDAIASMTKMQEKNSQISTDRVLETGISQRHQQLAESALGTSRTWEANRKKSKISTSGLVQTRIVSQDQAITRR